LRKRYLNERVEMGMYTFTANILIALNPFKRLAIYDMPTIQRYQGKSLGVEPPHVFAVADKAFRDMKATKLSQSVIVSGESGAGKTESTKYVIRYLSVVGKSEKGDIEERILQANPLLEAFGNAKTTRNHNSSRFGKFIELHFTTKSVIDGAFISHYVLEKSRIIRQSSDERNYHIFYRLCRGAPADYRKNLGLTDCADYSYLKNGMLGNVDGLDDIEDFKFTEEAMARIGMSPQEQQNVLRITAAVLHLGNIVFEENTADSKGGSKVNDATDRTLKGVATMLGMNPEELKERLTSRIMQSIRGGGTGTIYRVPLKVEEASNARDALAKAVYSRLFDWIVNRINQCFPYDQSAHYIGVLDIAGFEFFQHNSFEQFCINFCNEKLQQFFNEKVLKQEQEIYVQEGIAFTQIEYLDNQDVIDLIEAKGTGIFSLLDEESKMPNRSDIHFASTIHAKHKKHFRLGVPRDSKLPSHRKLKDDEGFLIRHYAGAVCYQVEGFIDKNNDALHGDLEALMLESADPFTKSLFEKKSNAADEEDPKKKGNDKGGKLYFSSLGTKFKQQLDELMSKLKSTRTNFIRCIKPNQKMKPGIFSGGEILSQLQCAGMVEVLALLQGGYPSRTAFADLYNLYKKYLPAKLSSLDPRTFCQALFKALGMDESHFQFGTTKVFFKSGKFAEFDMMTRADPENLAKLVEKVMEWLLRKRWRKAVFSALVGDKIRRKLIYRAEALVVAQKIVRGYLAQKKFRPKIIVRRRISSIQDQVKIVSEIVEKLKKDKDKMQKKLAEIEELVKKLKDGFWTLGNNELKEQADAVDDVIAKVILELKSKKKEQEEEERLRQLQEEADRERKKKEEEERRLREEEEERKKRSEMELARKKAEEEESKRQVEYQKQLERESKDPKLQAEKLRERQKELMREQDRRDQEMAYRVGGESGELTELQREARENDDREAKEAAKARKKSKYDVSKLKYSELRDIINTSCDMELLEACREEFHRRLKVCLRLIVLSLSLSARVCHFELSLSPFLCPCFCAHMSVSSGVPRLEDKAREQDHLAGAGSRSFPCSGFCCWSYGWRRSAAATAAQGLEDGRA
jgi:myosin VI